MGLPAATQANRSAQARSLRCCVGGKAMSNLHSCSNLSSLFERFRRKTTQISEAVRPPMTRARRRLSETIASVWSAVRPGTSHTHRH
jgi:hypothetical protein